MAEAAGGEMIWETDAASYNAAMRSLYEHMGWDPYNPMLRKDGTPYPEAEDDAIRQRMEAAYSSAWIVTCPTSGGKVQLPRNPDAEDLARGYYEWRCPCGGTHTLRFGRDLAR